jgi:hypothetical protein
VTGQKEFITVKEMSEMESVIYSISYGKHIQVGRVFYQAFSAAISSPLHVELVLSFIARRQKIREAKSSVVAYRISDDKAAKEQEGDL